MLLPKKVKFRKWQTARRNPKRIGSSDRGATLAFGSFGLKAMSSNRIKSNQLESARKTMSRTVSKVGRMWTRVFPDRPFTAKPPEVKLGKGKGDPQGYCVEIWPGRIIFEIDGVEEKAAREALRKAGTKLPIKTKIVSRTH